MANPSNIYVGVARLELHIPEARSLKAKRSVTRSLIERLRSRHQVLVTEADHQDLHQRATLAIVAMSSDTVDLESRLQRVERSVDQSWGGHVLSWETDILQV